MSVNLSVEGSSLPGGHIFVHRVVLPYLRLDSNNELNSSIF